MATPLDRDTVVPRIHHLAFWLVLVGAATFVLVAILLFDTYYGDSSIYLSYARNISTGDFFSFNSGEFSSGSTSPLWALLLAAPYLVGAGLTGAKVLAILIGLAAWITSLVVTARVTDSRLGATVGGLYLVGYFSFWAVLGYEAPLVVLAIALSIAAGHFFISKTGHGEGLTLKVGLPLILTWALIPLCRPDASILVVAEALALWAVVARKNACSLLYFLGLTMIAAVPSIIYFGYSWLELGTPSVSGQGRLFLFRDEGQRFGPLLFSQDGLKHLIKMSYAVVIGVTGFALMFRKANLRWLGIYGLIGILIYILPVFTIAASADPHYFIPLALFSAVGIAYTVKFICMKITSPLWSTAVIGLLAIMFLYKPIDTVRDARHVSQLDYGPDRIMQKAYAEVINKLAQAGDSLVAYEVQLRYFLRKDVKVLSLDGITDNRVAPYLEGGDLTTYLKKYRPKYLIPPGVSSRPFLQKSILHKLALRYQIDPRLKEISIDGIEFNAVDRHPGPSGPTIIELNYS